jgi:hypothetical protein
MCSIRRCKDVGPVVYAFYNQFTDPICQQNYEKKWIRQRAELPVIFFSIYCIFADAVLSFSAIIFKNFKRS